MTKTISSEKAKRVAKQPPAAEAAPERPFRPHVENIDYGDLDSLVGYAVRRAQILIYEDFDRELGPAGVTPQRYAALTIIARNPGLNQTELGNILGIARSGAMLLVNQLQAMGYVQRSSRADDKRSNGLSLTPAGRTALDGVSRRVMRHDRRIAAGLDDEERRTLFALLSKLGPPASSE